MGLSISQQASAKSEPFESDSGAPALEASGRHVLAEATRRYAVRDFVETQSGLIFAVVSPRLDDGCVIGYLRYRREGRRVIKLSTAEAVSWLQAFEPDLLVYSESRDTWVQAIPEATIVRHARPRQRLAVLLEKSDSDPVHEALRGVCRHLAQLGISSKHFGISGSVLLGVHRPDSDLDLVCYDRPTFHRVRQGFLELPPAGPLRPLELVDWRTAYDRRRPALSLDDYVWHERRKGTKALWGDLRVDLSLVDEDQPPLSGGRKLGCYTIQAQVVDDEQAFNMPAVWKIKHELVSEVVSFTATYSGQVYHQEWMEAAGMLELDEHGGYRLVIGSSREAPEEFIRTLQHHHALGD